MRHVLLLLVMATLSGCAGLIGQPSWAYNRVGVYNPGNSISAAARTAETMNSAVNQAAGCHLPGSNCSTYRRAEGTVDATRGGIYWHFNSRSGAAQGRGNFGGPGLGYGNSGFGGWGDSNQRYHPRYQYYRDPYGNGRNPGWSHW